MNTPITFTNTVLDYTEEQFKDLDRRIEKLQKAFCSSSYKIIKEAYEREASMKETSRKISSMMLELILANLTPEEILNDYANNRSEFMLERIRLGLVKIEEKGK